MGFVLHCTVQYIYINNGRSFKYLHFLFSTMGPKNHWQEVIKKYNTWIFVVNICASNPCKNNGSCDEDKQRCNCTEGFTGDFCERKCECIVIPYCSNNTTQIWSFIFAWANYKPPNFSCDSLPLYYQWSQFWLPNHLDRH